MSTIIVDKFKAARRAGVPLLAINTADPIYLLSRLTGAAENGTETPLIRWDCVKGWVAVNGAGDIAIRNVFQKAIAEQRLATPEAVERFIQKMTTNGTESLTWAEELPERSILFYINPQRFLRESSQGVAGFSQAIANLRDPFKESQRTLVLAGTGVTTLPAELQSDVLSLDDPLPTAEELQGVLETLITGNELEIEPESIAKGVDALRGLAPFAAEQAAAMSLERTGIKLDELWERKRKMIEQTPGLQVWKGGEKFEDIAGIVNAKLYARAILAGRSAPKVIVFIDEIEKAFAGATKGTGDSSGVSQAFLGTMLKHMQDRKSKGVVCIGPPGAAKSAFAKAIGNEAGILTVAFDLTAMKNSLVGSSEGNLARALDVVDAVGDGNAMFVATCNKIADLPPGRAGARGNLDAVPDEVQHQGDRGGSQRHRLDRGGNRAVLRDSLRPWLEPEGRSRVRCPGRPQCGRPDRRTPADGKRSLHLRFVLRGLQGRGLHPEGDRETRSQDCLIVA
jgi:hypothetical protein